MLCVSLNGCIQWDHLCPNENTEFCWISELWERMDLLKSANYIKLGEAGVCRRAGLEFDKTEKQPGKNKMQSSGHKYNSWTWET